MPVNAALVTALILDRPTCLPCVVLKSALTESEVESTLATIAPVLSIHRATERCRACGETRTVISLVRPGA